ncbi:MAG: transcriptional regulator [Planctomycetes bacterium]|nr:transcriptional regulator [Planctomycetota bacterium]
MKTDIPEKAREKILFFLKTKGPQAAGQIAKRLGVTAMAVRQHLYSLQEEGAVEFTDERRKVGRPARIWNLTRETSDRFPDSHGELAVGILNAARRAFGEEGVSRLIAQRTEAQAESYGKQLAKKKTLGDKVAQLAEIRSDEGYMAEWLANDGGSFTLIENNCPICAAAESCQDLCRGELNLFTRVLGEVEIEREEHILSGQRRCVYRIAPAKQLA